MKRVVIISMLLLLVAFPALAAKGFDSLKPPYGEELSKMQYRKHFVQYAKKNGITYYNYLGPRIPNPVYEMSSPRISYGFVDGRLYSMIYQNWDVPRSKVMEQIRTTYGQIPKKSFDEGDWAVYVWYFEDLNVDFKLKYNSQTMEMKSAFYYRPLKKQLNK